MRGNMTFQPELWSKVEPEIRGLIEAHWRELAMFKDKIPLDIDWDHYRTCEDRGILQVTTARTLNGDLAGYWISVVNIHPHYKSTKFAFQDSYFLLPQFRKANTGLGLMVEMEKNVREMGARAIIASDKEILTMVGLFGYCRYVSPGQQYMKWIGEG